MKNELDKTKDIAKIIYDEYGGTRREALEMATRIRSNEIRYESADCHAEFLRELTDVIRNKRFT